MKAFVKDPLTAINLEIEGQDWAAFESAYEAGIIAANAYHRRWEHEEIVWQLPDEPPKHLRLTSPIELGVPLIAMARDNLWLLRLKYEHSRGQCDLCARRGIVGDDIKLVQSLGEHSGRREEPGTSFMLRCADPLACRQRQSVNPT